MTAGSVASVAWHRLARTRSSLVPEPSVARLRYTSTVKGALSRRNNRVPAGQQTGLPDGWQAGVRHARY
jgi:hypothetical protein